MEIALIKSYSNKTWRSPETCELIEESLRKNGASGLFILKTCSIIRINQRTKSKKAAHCQ